MSPLLSLPTAAQDPSDAQGTRALDAELVIVGGGPAGLAAAATASETCDSVLLIDDNPSLGGQIWRQGNAAAPVAAARPWLDAVAAGNVGVLAPATVIDAPGPGRLIVGPGDGRPEARNVDVTYRRLILATGATERFLPFPGWTLPGVVGAGGLQALIKSGLDVEGKRIVIAGSGPLLLAVADLAKRRGALVSAIVEQADFKKVAAFGRHVAVQPKKALQAAAFARSLAGVKKYFATWPVKAYGEDLLESVELRRASGESVDVDCDWLACGFGLRPETRLAAALGCAVVDGRVVVDERRQTTVDGVYCAGEPTGIGGVDAALLDGRIAGQVAVGRPIRGGLRRRGRRSRRFVQALDAAYALRPALRDLPEDDTVVCRCEDVPWGRLQAYDQMRDAKLKTRCGMGPCQGRVCGGALEILKGFRPETARPPFFPIALSSLASSSAPCGDRAEGAVPNASQTAAGSPDADDSTLEIEP